MESASPITREYVAGYPGRVTPVGYTFWGRYQFDSFSAVFSSRLGTFGDSSRRCSLTAANSIIKVRLQNGPEWPRMVARDCLNCLLNLLEQWILWSDFPAPLAVRVADLEFQMGI